MNDNKSTAIEHNLIATPPTVEDAAKDMLVAVSNLAPGDMIGELPKSLTAARLKLAVALSVAANQIVAAIFGRVGR